MTTVLKLGGSVITRKDRPETVDQDALDRAARALSTTKRDFVVVHGGGSFGHHHAAKHGVSSSVGTHDDDAIRAIHGAMKQLNRAVIGALSAVDVPAVPVHPFSAMSRGTDGRLRFDGEPVSTILSEGFVPVLHGDVVAHEQHGATVVSGDDLVVSLSNAVSADRVGICSTVPGVYDTDGNVVDRIDSFEDIADAVGESNTTDVTGGMAGKVRALLALDSPAYVFGPDGLDVFLDGGTPGTRID